MKLKSFLEKRSKSKFSWITLQALYDCFEETVKELRLQLRQKEALENLSGNLKETLNQRDAELDAFKSENEALKKQKDALMKAFG